MQHRQILFPLSKKSPFNVLHFRLRGKTFGALEEFWPGALAAATRNSRRGSNLCSVDYSSSPQSPSYSCSLSFDPLPPLDSICLLMTVWGIAGKMFYHNCHNHKHTRMSSSYRCIRACWFKFSFCLLCFYACCFLN